MLMLELTSRMKAAQFAEWFPSLPTALWNLEASPGRPLVNWKYITRLRLMSRAPEFSACCPHNGCNHVLSTGSLVLSKCSKSTVSKRNRTGQKCLLLKDAESITSMRKAVVSQGYSEMTNCVWCQVHKANHLVWLSQFLRKKRYIVYKESAHCFSRCIYCFWGWYLLSFYLLFQFNFLIFFFLFYIRIELWSEEQMELHFAGSSVDSYINFTKCRNCQEISISFWDVLGLISFTLSEINGINRWGTWACVF